MTFGAYPSVFVAREIAVAAIIDDHRIADVRMEVAKISVSKTRNSFLYSRDTSLARQSSRRYVAACRETAQCRRRACTAAVPAEILGPGTAPRHVLVL